MIAAQARWEQAVQHEPITWTDTTVHEELDGDGRVKERSRDLYEAVRLFGMPYLRHVLHDGKPLEGKARREAEEEERAFAEKARKGQRVDGEGFQFDHTILQRFDFTLEGDTEREGTPCTLLSFRPRRHALPEIRPQERVLNNLRGELCIDPVEGGIVDLHAFLPEPTSVGWILGRVSTVDIIYRQQRLDDGLWAPRYLRFEIRARALVKQMNRRSEVWWSKIAR